MESGASFTCAMTTACSVSSIAGLSVDGPYSRQRLWPLLRLGCSAGMTCGVLRAAAAIDGAFSMAMHVHASFSEMFGSMNAQLFQAVTHDIDVVWWTEHDTKMNGANYRRVVHFTSLTDELEDGSAWQWRAVRSGRHTGASGGGIVTSPASPLDTESEGSMQVTAQSADQGSASFGFAVGRMAGHQDWRTNLTAQTLRLEVLPTSIGQDAYLEFFVLHLPPSGFGRKDRGAVHAVVPDWKVPGRRAAAGPWAGMGS